MRHHVITAVCAIAGSLVLVGCGSSGQTPATGANASAGVHYASCLRAHGVPNFPDPSGGGIQIPNGVNPSSPAFEHAQAACQSLMPGGRIGRATGQEKQTMLALSQCMRNHGVSGFPDPVASPPKNPVGLRMAFGRPGSIIVVPDALDPDSPKFRQAAQACHFPGT